MLQGPGDASLPQLHTQHCVAMQALRSQSSSPAQAGRSLLRGPPAFVHMPTLTAEPV